MLERGIRVLWPYLKAMDPFWVAASFAAGLVCYAAIKKKSRMHAGVDSLSCALPLFGVHFHRVVKRHQSGKSPIG